MTLRYQVDTKLPEPVFIVLDEVVEILSPEAYLALIKPVENLDPEAEHYTFKPRSTRFGGDIPQVEPGVQVRSDFFKWNTPVRLDNGTMALIYTNGKIIKVGDHVRYDVRVDQMAVFDPAEVKCKLTLVENTDAS